MQEHTSVCIYSCVVHLRCVEAHVQHEWYTHATWMLHVCVKLLVSSTVDLVWCSTQYLSKTYGEYAYTEYMNDLIAM